MLSSIVPSSDGGADALEYRFNFESSDGIYSFELLRLSESTRANGVRVAKRQIRLRCLDKCKCENVYTEDVGAGSGWPTGSGLLGVFLAIDGSRHLVTTWAAGTSYNVEVYGCQGGRLGRVLAINSRMVPFVYPDRFGMPVIKYSPDYDRPNLRATLHWNGHGYVNSAKVLP
jgi:hypothetical protein